jgi:hypothetical protein
MSDEASNLDTLRDAGRGDIGFVHVLVIRNPYDQADWQNRPDENQPVWASGCPGHLAVL